MKMLSLSFEVEIPEELSNERDIALFEFFHMSGDSTPDIWASLLEQVSD